MIGWFQSWGCPRVLQWVTGWWWGWGGRSRGDSTPCSPGRLGLGVNHPPANRQERLLLIKYCGEGEGTLGWGRTWTWQGGTGLMVGLHQVFCARQVWRKQDERVRVEQSLCHTMLCLTGTQPSCHSRASPREPLWCCLACRTSSTPPPGPAGRSERSLGHRQETLKVRVITDRIHAQTPKDMKYITVGMIYNFDPGAADLRGNCHSKRIWEENT